MSAQGINESRLYMWRTIIAVAHADGIITTEETDFLSAHFGKEALSSGQKELLGRDLLHPQNPENMFLNISATQDRDDFFRIAKELSESDGDFCTHEKKLLSKLNKKNLHPETFLERFQKKNKSEH